MINNTIIFLLVILLIFTIYFTITEFTLLRVSKYKLLKMSSQKKYGSKYIPMVLQDFNKYIYTVQAGIIFTTVTFGILAWSVVKDLTQKWALPGIWNYLVIFAMLVFIGFILSSLGELAPKKAIDPTKIESIAITTIPLLIIIVKLATPYIFILRKFSSAILKIFRINPISDIYKNHYDKNNIIQILSEVRKDNVISEGEYKLMMNILQFEDKKVQDIQTPRKDIIAVPKDIEYKELIELARKTGYSRFPIYEDVLDNIVGIIHIKDIILNGKSDEFSIMNYKRDPIFIYEEMDLARLLHIMQTKRVQLVLVFDEFGSLEGLIALEDVVESIIGPINDEYDPFVQLIKPINKFKYRVNAKVSISEFNTYFNTNLQTKHNRSIGGYIFEKLNALPEHTQKLEFENLVFSNFNVEKNRIIDFDVSIKQTNLTTKLERLNKSSIN